MKTKSLSRRAFLKRSVAATIAAPLAARYLPWKVLAADNSSAAAGSFRPDAKVAIAACRTYGPEVRVALEQAFDLLGGIGPLVKDKTVAVKINLTGTSWAPFMGRPAGETFMTHYTTAMALGSALFGAGARRVRFVESTAGRDGLEEFLVAGGWDVPALSALGRVEFENTRNLGQGKRYAPLKVSGPGYMFSSFDLNHSYADTDVMISLAKLKNHATAGVTLSMKNLFGITPNTLYGTDRGEDATGVRYPLHNPTGYGNLTFPGMKDGPFSNLPTWRVPHITADVCAARPIDIAIIDGITAMSGGEGPWIERRGGTLKATFPGVIIAGLNMVSTDAVATAVMGYDNPRATGAKPFDFCENHILLAEQAGLGTADLSRIDVRGVPIEKAKCHYG